MRKFGLFCTFVVVAFVPMLAHGESRLFYLKTFPTLDWTPDHAQGQGPYQPLAADFDGDGKYDLALRKVSTGEFWIRVGDGKGGFPTHWKPYGWDARP